MCEPITIALAVSAALSTAMAAKQAKNQTSLANRKAHQQLALNERNKEQALVDEQVNLDALASREDEETRAYIQNSQQAGLAAVDAQAQAEVMAAERGASGLSVDSLKGDIQRQSGQNISNLDYNFKQTQAQLNRERYAVKVGTANTLAGLPSPVFRSAPVGAIVADGAVKAAGSVYSNKAAWADMFSSSGGTSGTTK